jgi:hypothetical protein
MTWPLPQPSAALATDVTAQTTRHADDHNKLAALLAVLTPGPWQYVNVAGGAAPAFNSPWANYGGVYQPLRFRREGGDICRIEGIVGGNATTGTSVFTLPLGFRPANNGRMYSQVDTGTGNPGRLDLAAAGTVTLSYLTGSGAVSFAPIYITFVIDPTTL